MGNHGYYQFAGLPLGTYYISIDISQPAISGLGLVATRTNQGSDATIDSNMNPSTVTLTQAAPQDETVDFGFTSPGTSALGNFVWQDNNANGIQDSGEPGLSGLTVKLCSDPSCNTVLATTTTDQNGVYSFTSLFGGIYFVQVVPGQNFVATTPQVGYPGNNATDSGGNVSGIPAEVNLPVNTVDNTIDFGFIPPAQGVIGDYVWHDLNRDGIQDANEPGINNVTIRLYDSGNVLVGTTTTVTNGPDGYYQFTGLAAGTYSVLVDTSTVPVGYSATTTNAPGSTTSNDSNGSPAAVTLPTNVSADKTIDFGYVSACAGVIGDFVWNDLNQNGIQDSGEPGIPGLTVSLYDSSHSFLLSTTTDANGLYHFNGRCAGTYTVAVTPPANFTASPANASGSTPANDNNGSPAVVTLGIDETNNSVDFGFFQPLSVACSATSAGEVGAAFDSGPMTVTGGTAPYTFSVATGSIPAGLSLDTATGAVTGTATAAGTFTLKVTDSKGVVAAGTCPFTIIAGPSLTCSATSAGEVGAAFDSGPMTVTGGTAPYTFSVATGSIPAGLSLNTTTGAVTGTATAAGTFTLKVTDAKGVVATGTCPFTIIAGPSLTCSATSTGEVGAAFNSGSMTVTGGTAPYMFSVATGSIPAGLSLNTTTGAVTGTATAAGTFTLKVTDAKGVVATGTCPFTIIAGPSLTCSATSTGEVGAAFNSGSMTVTGGTAPYMFSVATGSIPAGLSLNTTTGAVTGTATAAGTFTLKVTDAKGVVAAGTCPFTIIAGPSLTCSATSAGEVGVAFNSGSMTVTGGTAPYTFSVATGSIPAGLSLNTTTGAVTGTATAAGTFTLKVTDAKGVVAAGTCPFTIIAGPSLTCSATSTGLVGSAFNSGPITVTGGTAPYTFSIVGTLPAGLSLNTLTGAITGIPIASATFTIRVTDALGVVAAGTCPITIGALPVCTGNLGPVTYNVSENGSNVAGEIVWFNSHLVKLGGTIPAGDFQIFINQGTITFGTSTLSVPDAVITFSAAATGASTSFDTVANTWRTTIPLSSAGSADEIFAAALAYALPSNFAQNVKNVTWSATVSTTAPALQVSWQYGISNWLTQKNGTSFPVLTGGAPDYNGMMIDPAHNAPLANPAYNTGDHAGAPEFVGRSNVLTGGGSGGGGSNWTGSWSSTPPKVGFVCPGSVTHDNGPNGVATGDAATIGFWHNKNGQALILSLNGGASSKALATWLAIQFPYLYGAQSPNDLTNKTNTEVAALFMTFFNVTGQKTNAQIMSGALASYVTSSSLAGTAASKYGFNISAGGTGAKTYNVGNYGAAMGLTNNLSYTVLQLLQQANLMLMNGTFDANAFNSVFDGINTSGDIV